MDNIKEKIDIMKDKISEEKTENQIDKVDLLKEINEIKDTISYILDLIQTRNF